MARFSFVFLLMFSLYFVRQVKLNSTGKPQQSQSQESIQENQTSRPIRARHKGPKHSTASRGSSNSYVQNTKQEQDDASMNLDQNNNNNNNNKNSHNNNEESFSGESINDGTNFTYEKPTQATRPSLKPTLMVDTTLPMTTTTAKNSTVTPSMRPTDEQQSTPLPPNRDTEYSGSGDGGTASGDHISFKTTIRAFSPTMNPTDPEKKAKPSKKPAMKLREKLLREKLLPQEIDVKKHEEETNEDEKAVGEIFFSVDEKRKKENETKVEYHIHTDYEEDEKNTDQNAEGETENETENEDETENEEENPISKSNTAVEIEKRILCIGDSITEGYYENGKAFHPYSKRLFDLLNSENNSVTYNVYNEGVSGECVYDAMTLRMPEMIEKYKPLDLVIILGGTNDLGKINCSSEILFENILSLHKMAHDAKAKTVAITIPDSNVPMMPVRNQTEDMWKEVNEKIREFAKNNDDVILCDLAEELPFRTMSDDERAKYWDDNLHYTPRGYDKMAEIIYDAIQGEF